MRGSVKLWLAGAALLSQSVAYGLGLGGIEVRSGLNEPLEAEIRLVASPGETVGLEVRLASAEEFARVGIDRARLGVPLEFTVGRNARGEEVIRVTSTQAIREPFLSFLVDVNWPAGRLLREYTVLLDPPVMAPAVRGTGVTSAPVRDPVVSAPRDLDPQDPPTADPARPAVTAPRAADAPSRTLAAGEYGPIAAGETLWEIAREVSAGTAVSIHQMMLALLQANPNAFVDGNINALRRGQILRVPDEQEAQRLTQAQAIAEVRIQNDVWRSRTPSAPTLFADAGTPASTPARPGTGVRDDARLEIVPPRTGRDTGVGAAERESELTAEIARIREELASSQQEGTELRSRVRELESLRSNQERMINIKSEELEAIQAQLRRAREQLEDLRLAAEAGERLPEVDYSPVAPERDRVAAVVEDDDIWGTRDDDEEDAISAIPDVDPLDPVGLDDPLDDAADDYDPVTGERIAAVDTDSAADPFTPPVTADPVVSTPVEPAVSATPRVSPSIVTPPQQTPIYMQPWFMGGAALLVVLLGVFGLTRLRRKAPAGGGSLASRVAAAGGSAAAAGSDPSGGLAGEDEASLLAEIDADPENAGLRLELLSVYFANGDRERFESAAEAMYAQIADPGQDEWQEAVRMGKELCPDNDLFISSDELDLPADEHDPFSVDQLADQAEDAFGQDFSTSDAEPEEDLFDLDSAFDDAPAAAPPSSFGSDEAETRKREAVRPAPVAPPPAPEPEADPVFDLDFESDPGLDLDLGDAPDSSAAAEDDLGAGLDFDLDFDADTTSADADTQVLSDLAAKVPSAPEPAAAADPLEEATLDLEEDFFGGEDAVGTKLDLAKAYLDMGDPEGARSMLEEVMSEGNEGQRREAEQLIKGI